MNFLALNCYKIAVIIAGINESYQSAILSGIEASAAKYSFNIDTFVSFSGIMGNQKHDTGEFNIFNLPDFSDYDGAILLTNTIAYQPVIRNILSRIKDAAIPAVSIDNDIDGFYYIGSDNDKAMRDVVNHFIHHHGFTRFNYISGPADNPESADRLDAFLSVLHENNITVEDERIYYGDFRAASGKTAAKHFLESHLEMPQAIICANDAMAVSVMKTLSDAGYCVPDDIAVSGFDNTYSARNYPTKLTTVDRPLKRSGSLACTVLHNHFSGIRQERCLTLELQPKFTESCGCSITISHDVETFKKLNYKNFAKFENAIEYTSFFNRMSCKFSECYNLSEYIEAINPFISELNPQELYICLCSDWNSDSSDHLFPAEYENAPFTVEGYTQTVTVPIAYKNGEFIDVEQFPSKQILPDCAGCGEHGHMFYLAPLHFGERCLGYIAARNCSIPTNSSMFHTWCINISNSIENIRKITCLDYAVQRLEKLYTLDTFTGINNRNGFVKETTRIYNQCADTGAFVMLMFIDLDGLKRINDAYGHSVGDNAIMDIADVIRCSCTEGEVFCRFGGDEFIIFGADYTEDDALLLSGKINLNIEKINSSKRNPFRLSASLGYYITKAIQGADIFQFVTLADKMMYKEKRKKNLSKYLKS